MGRRVLCGLSELCPLPAESIDLSCMTNLRMFCLQGRHCSRCMYNQHCKGCTISRDSHISLRTEDTLAVTFTDDVQEVCEIRDPSMTFQRAYKTLTLYDCVQAFSQRYENIGLQNEYCFREGFGNSIGRR